MNIKDLRSENVGRIDSIARSVSDGRDASEVVLSNRSTKVASGEEKKPWPSPPSPPAT